MYGSRYCADGGPLLDGTITLNGMVRIHFVSDGSQNLAGFRAEFFIPTQIVFDPCQGISCSNRGQCIDGSCVCDSGFFGEDCEVNIDECNPDPCVNGQCFDGLNSYQCVCSSGWTGP